jgi:hypothetical protein
MTPPAFFALFSRSESISFEGCQRIAASVQAQLNEDVTPIWGRKGTITAYNKESDVPAHYWKVVIEDDIGQPGALGYHTDEFNQPEAYVAAQGGDINAVCTTVSHEVLETLMDFSGNRLITILHPENSPLNHRRVRMLCEVCDPPEAKSYEKLGLQVSDFITPEWYDDSKKDGVRYTFLGSIDHPRQLAPGGYCSFIDTDKKWYQLVWWDQEPQLKGPFAFDTADESLRETVDKHVRLTRP